MIKGFQEWLVNKGIPSDILEQTFKLNRKCGYRRLSFYFPHALVRTTKYSKPTGATQSCSSERRYVLAQYSDARNRTQQTSRNIFRVISFSKGNGWMRRSEKGLDPPLAPRPKLGQLSSLEGEGMALDIIRCSSKRSREATLPVSPLLASWSGPTHPGLCFGPWSNHREQPCAVVF